MVLLKNILKSISTIGALVEIPISCEKYFSRQEKVYYRKKTEEDDTFWTTMLKYFGSHLMFTLDRDEK